MHDPLVDDLLRHEPFLGRIVGDIVGTDDVPDVLQKTWLAALQGPQPRRESLRPWLARVARNFAYEHLRSELNRRAREQDASSPSAPPDVQASLDRVVLRRRLAWALRSLSEPYRRPILLRYVHEMPYVRIAAELGLTEPTARKRVERALVQLRERLLREERGESGRRSLAGILLLPFLPFLHRGARPTVRSLPRTAAVWAAAVLAVTTLVVLRTSASPSVRPDRGVAGVAGVPTTATASGVPSPASVAALDGVVAPAGKGGDGREGPEGIGSSGADGPPWRGRVVDLLGEPVAGVGFTRGECARGEERTVLGFSDADGRFLLPVSLGSSGGAAEAPDGLEVVAPHVAVYSSCSPESVWRSRLDDQLVVVAPGASATGVVRDEHGALLEGVEVLARLVEPVQLPLPLTRTVPRAPVSTRTGPDGTFALDGLAARATRLVLHREGSAPLELPLESAGENRFDVRLRPERQRGRGPLLVGVVRDVEGRPLEGARVGVSTVGVGTRMAHTVADGYYELELPPDAFEVPGVESLRAFAGAAGCRTRERTVERSHVFGEDGTHGLDWTLEPAAEIAGRVELPNGEPWAGAFVVPWGEPELAGGLRRIDLAQESLDPPDYFGLPYPAVARTDAQGRFRLGGFAPGEHRLGFVAPGLELVHVAPLAAGTEDALLRVPAPATRRLVGRLVDPAGAPAAGVDVELSVQVLPVGRTNSWRFSGQRARTGPDGRFDLGEVPAGCQLLLSLFRPPDVFVPVVVDPASAVDEWVAEPLVYFQVSLPPGDDAAETAWLLDGDGLPVPIVVAHQNRWFQVRDAFRLRDGRTGVLGTSARARTLAVAGAPELALPLRLDAARVTTVGG